MLLGLQEGLFRKALQIGLQVGSVSPLENRAAHSLQAVNETFELLVQTEMDKKMYHRSLLAAVPAPIWLDIFVTVQTLTGGLRTPAQYKHYHMLRLVCKHFNDLFVQHSELSRHILLRPDYPSSCLPSLLGHLHRCGRSPLTMDLTCTDADVLSCVLQQRLELVAISLNVVSQATVALLSGLYSLQRCELTSPQTNICLEPMSGLPVLKSLKLSGGNFTSLQSFAHLTNFEVLQARAHASGVVKCQFSSKLQKLVVKNGRLHNLDVEGLSGCRNLQALTIHGHSRITAESAEDTFSLLRYPSHIPPSISKLSALTELALDVVLNGRGGDLPWLYQLTGLQSLQLQLFGDASHTYVTVYIGTELAALSDLRTLYVSLNEDDGLVCINVKWQLMHALQHVTLRGSVGLSPFLTFMSDLVSAPNLQTLSLCQWELTHPDPCAGDWFEHVVRKLTLMRPDVHVLLFGSQPVQQGQW